MMKISSSWMTLDFVRYFLSIANSFLKLNRIKIFERYRYSKNLMFTAEKTSIKHHVMADKFISSS